MHSSECASGGGAVTVHKLCCTRGRPNPCGTCDDPTSPPQTVCTYAEGAVRLRLEAGVPVTKQPVPPKMEEAGATAIRPLPLINPPWSPSVQQQTVPISVHWAVLQESEDTAVMAANVSPPTHSTSLLCIGYIIVVTLSLYIECNAVIMVCAMGPRQGSQSCYDI